MKKGLLTGLMMMISVITIWAQNDKAGIEGRWDISYNRDGRVVPSWLEVLHSGTSTLVGYFVSDGGSARPVSVVNVDGNRFSFSIPPQWEEGKADLKVEGTFGDDKLSGTITLPNTKNYSFNANRAPSLRKPTTNISWGEPIQLFNGKDLTGWKALGTKSMGCCGWHTP